MRHTFRVGGTILVCLLGTLFSRPPASGQDEDPKQVAIRAKALKTGRAKLERSVDRAVAKVAKIVEDRVVALLRVRPDLEKDLPTPTSALLDAMLQRAFLLGGVLVSDVEEEGPIPAHYERGKLSSKSRVDGKERTRLREDARVAYALEARWASSNDRLQVSLRLTDLASGRTQAKLKLSRIDARKVPLADLLAVRPFPDANKAILLLAARMFGKTVGRGECWDLPAHALIALDAQPNGYDFGTEVSFPEALPGDVLTIDERGQHHVMVLWKKGKTLGTSMILHQNWNQKRFVTLMRCPLSVIQGSILWRPGS